MAVKFGTPVRPSDLLALLVDEVRRATAHYRYDVVESVLPDQYHLDAPPADRFVVVSAAGLRHAADPGVAGGGRYLTGFDLGTRIALYGRVSVDQELRSAAVLHDPGRGLLPAALVLLDGLQMWTPLAPDGTCYLREPARLSPAGFAVAARADKAGGPWAMVESSWSVKFTALLQTDPLPA